MSLTLKSNPMKFLLINARAIICLVIIASLLSCKKKNEPEPLVITPTVNPIPYSVLAYLMTPADKTFNPDYYRAAKSTLIELQGWYKTHMDNNKTFVLNSVVLDTITAMHNANWFIKNNGDSINDGTVNYPLNNTRYELEQLLGSKFDTTLYVYCAFVASPGFSDVTIPRGVGVLGEEILKILAGSFPDDAKGETGHALGHAFGLPEVAVPNTDGIMSGGVYKYPDCVIKPWEKDSLNAGPFFKVQ